MGCSKLVILVNQSAAQQILRFGDFELDLRAGELRKRGIRISLQNQVFELLRQLARMFHQSSDQGDLGSKNRIREDLGSNWACVA